MILATILVKKNLQPYEVPNFESYVTTRVEKNL
jgi:hypothetical protein